MTALRLFAVLALFCIFVGSLLASPVAAQTKEPPFWAVTRFDTVNMRVGPSGDYPIDWVYRRRGLPLQVVRKREGWLFVIDPDGARGWISASQMRARRGALVTGEVVAALREEPSVTARILWQLEPGNVAQLSRCEDGWCEITIEGRTGWIKAQRIWGDEPLEEASE